MWSLVLLANNLGTEIVSGMPDNGLQHRHSDETQASTPGWTTTHLTMNDPPPLDPRLETARRAFLVAHRIGVLGTKAIVDAGLADVSSNAAISVLKHLVVHGPSRPRELLPITRLSRGGLSNLFTKLESDGFITRTYGTSPGDRRSATVTITAAGSAAMSTIDDAVAGTLESLRPELLELDEAIGSIGISPDEAAPDVERNATIGATGLLSRTGAAMGAALDAVDPDDPTPASTAVVLACAAGPGHTQPKELIEETGLSSSGVSQLLDRLEGAGLVSRQSGRLPDGRAVVVELTGGGHRELVLRLTKIADHLALLSSAINDRHRR